MKKEQRQIKDEIIEEQKLSDERLEMLDDEQKREYINELRDATFDCWFDDNQEHLRKEFIDYNFDDFMTYCKETYKNEQHGCNEYIH